jgi:hypothetical protein
MKSIIYLFSTLAIGSLVGSLKLSGEEITKEKFSGSVTDWSIGNWSNPVDTLDRELSNVGNK